MKLKLSALCALVVLLLGAGILAQEKPKTSVPPQQPSSPMKARASFRGLGDFPGGKFESFAKRVSTDGTVIVGEGNTESGLRAFRWTDQDGMVSLGNLPDSGFKQTWANGVSRDGSVIVGYGDPDGGGWNTHKGFRWQGGRMALFGSINDSARYEVFAASDDGSVIVGDGGPQAFRWTQKGGAAALGVLPGRTNSRAIAVSGNGSVVVGSSYNLPNWDAEEAFRWTQAGGMQALGFVPGKKSSFPNAVSPDGSVIVGTSGSSWFRWTEKDGMVALGHLPDHKQTHPFAVNSNGTIVVGSSFVDRDHADAFIWDAAHGMRSLQEVLETEYGVDLKGWTLQCASDITPDGSVIVGWGKNPAGDQEAFRVVVSE